MTKLHNIFTLMLGFAVVRRLAAQDHAADPFLPAGNRPARPCEDDLQRRQQGTLDYIAYLVIVLGVGAAIFIASLPPLLLWSVERVALEPAPQVR